MKLFVVVNNLLKKKKEIPHGISNLGQIKKKSITFVFNDTKLRK